MARRCLETVVEGDVVQVTIYSYLVTFWSNATKTVQSTLSLPEMYQKHEHAATIEEID